MSGNLKMIRIARNSKDEIVDKTDFISFKFMLQEYFSSFDCDY